MSEMDKAISLLKPLLESIAIDRHRSIDIYGVDTSIIVCIDGCKYKINVECENTFAMIKSVIDKVILKF